MTTEKVLQVKAAGFFTGVCLDYEPGVRERELCAGKRLYEHIKAFAIGVRANGEKDRPAAGLTTFRRKYIGIHSVRYDRSGWAKTGILEVSRCLCRKRHYGDLFYSRQNRRPRALIPEVDRDCGILEKEGKLIGISEENGHANS